ncbi:hypothetical protein [Burkholderia glumae]|uniref:hypothetical protein n=1 Tax=Burkholderia glumae TaxID=337 RepID=UPI0021517F0A|nr:hypothetical protein [Burkholderia glumae]
MTTKGVDYYFYIASLPGTSITFSATDAGASKPKFTDIMNSDSARWGTGNVQIGVAGVGIYGEVKWSLYTNPVIERRAKINPLTGNLGGGSLADMMKTSSYTGGGLNVSYGFYDAGVGVGDLTNQDQVYCYFTGSMQNWMGDLVAQDASVNDAPFSSFVLPGAHDAGTFDLSAVKGLLAAGGAATTAFMSLLGPGAVLGAAVAGLTAAQATTAITNLAVTQKDDISTMLNLGCRYFDFRPGMLPKALQGFDGGIYHIHTAIPGYGYKAFLVDVLNWLQANPSEIVVVNANTAGFYDHASMDPSTDQLTKGLNDALNKTSSTVLIGSASDLSSSYSTLIAANKRLIFLNQIGEWYEASKYDSYNNSYKTTNPDNIIKAISAMNEQGQTGNDFTVLQLQGTASGTGTAVVVAAALSQSYASSPLMSTKAKFDYTTYPWVATNVPLNLGNGQLVVLLNDFVDNVLATTAQQLTLQRIQSLNSATKG